MATRQTGDTSFINLMNLDDNAYLRNRLKYHAASRIGIQTGQSLGQATNGDGHTVRYGQVWTAPDTAFIVQSTAAMKTTSDGIASNEELVANFKATGRKTITGFKGGNVYENDNYPAVRLYEQCEMNPVTGSNGSGTKYESYELSDENGSRIMDWIAPTSVKDGGLPVPGYTARIEAYKGSKWTDLQNCTDGSGAWALSEGNWEFVYMSGLCTFHPLNTPSGYSYTKLRITAFAYIGDYLSDTLSSMSSSTADHMMAIRPFTFSPGAMATTTVDDSTTKSIVRPGIVFNVFENTTGIVYGDITYLSGADAGKTQVTFSDWQAVDFGESPSFTAMAFVLSNGNVIPILAAQNMPDVNA